MYDKFLLSVSLLLVPALALSQGVTSYECTMDGKLRRVVILTEPGVPVPCEVQYHKDTEAPGDVQVLWSASTQAGYCETKATEFIGKLESWGWSCLAGSLADAAAMPEIETADEEESADQPEPAEAIADDTDALEPAD